MKYAVVMASGDMLYIPSFMTISSVIQVILRLLRQQFERLQFWHF
jgi:ribosomal protein L16 Arg81 hydroxylase